MGKRVLGLDKEHRLAAPMRQQYWNYIARKEQRNVGSVSASLRMAQLADISSLRPPGKKSSQDLYIFGNGSSVNNLSDENFEVISKQISIGLNAWPLHPFTTDFYSFEFDNSANGPSSELKLLLSKLSHKLGDDGYPKALFLRPSLESALRIFPSLSENLRDHSVLYGRVNVATKAESNLKRDLDLIVKALQRRKSDWSLLPDNGSSLVRMIFLGLISGFKRIVLVGVDLNGSDYFWYDPSFIDKYGDFRENSVRAKSESLATLSTQGRMFPVDVFIRELGSLAQREFDSEISVASVESRLSTVIPFRSIDI